MFKRALLRIIALYAMFATFGLGLMVFDLYAQADLIKSWGASWAVSLQMACLIGIGFVQRKFSLSRAFNRPSLIVFVTSALVFAALTFIPSNPATIFLRALVGQLTELLGIWVLHEVVRQILHPEEYQRISPRLTLTFEFSALIISFAAKVGLPAFLDHSYPLAAASLMFAGLLFAIMLAKLAPSDLGDIFSAKGKPSEKLSLVVPGHVGYITSWTAIVFLGAFSRNALELITRLKMQDVGSDTETIRRLLADYNLISSIGFIVLAEVMTRFINKRKVATDWWMASYLGIGAVLGAWLLISNSVAVGPWIMAAGIARAASRAWFGLGVGSCLGFFSGELFRSMRMQQIFMKGFLAPLPFAIVALLPTKTFDPILKGVSEWILLGSGLVGCHIALRVWGPRMRNILKYITSSENQTEAISALCALSILRTRDLVPEIKNLLSSPTIKNKVRVKLAIITSLGFEKSSESLETLMQIHREKSEELQLATLDAFRQQNSHRSIKVLIDLASTKIGAISAGVRAKAALMIGSIYGSKAVPFLLHGLESSDSRITANTLEVLTILKDPQLIPEFRTFINHPVSRVRANAALGLLGFRSTKTEARTTLISMLDDKEIPHSRSAALYVIGRAADKALRGKILQVANEYYGVEMMAGKTHLGIERALAWALFRLRDESAFEVYEHVISQNDNTYLHYIAQLTRSERFSLIRRLIDRHGAHSEVVQKLLGDLSNSNLELIDEANLIHSSKLAA